MNAALESIKSYDSPLYQCFVIPPLCADLKKEGLVCETPYKWKLLNKTATLFTTVFHHDGYYQEVVSYLDEFNKPYIIPAYQLKDIEKVMVPYVLSKTQGGYRLLCSFCEIKAERMPDVFALSFLHLVKHGMLNIDKCNKMINGI